MKIILVKNYQCEFCGEIFSMKWLCSLHEKEKHKCPNCKHSYYVYGCELNCALEKNNKRCRFKSKN